jgi:hypothetical protein
VDVASLEEAARHRREMDQAQTLTRLGLAVNRLEDLAARLEVLESQTEDLLVRLEATLPGPRSVAEAPREAPDSA